VRFLSPNPAAVIHVDMYFAGNERWQINFTGAVNYPGYSILLGPWTKLQRWFVGGEYYGGENNGSYADRNIMRIGFWDQNMNYAPANTQNDPRTHRDTGFSLDTGPRVFA
jgi:hypothetical protein